MTFSVYISTRKCYLHKDSFKGSYGEEMFWTGCDDFSELKKHPSLNAARKWVPLNRTDDEWETVIHEHDAEGKLIAIHPIKGNKGRINTIAKKNKLAGRKTTCTPELIEQFTDLPETSGDLDA